MSITQFPDGFHVEKNILTSFLRSKLIDHSKLSSICYFSVILLCTFFTAVITFWKKRHVYIREFIPSSSVHELLVNFMEFAWIWILKDYIEVQEKKNVTVLCCPSSTKRKIWYFHVLLGPTMAKKCTRKHAARAKFSVVLLACQFVTCRRILFPFPKWSLPCLTVYATVANQ